MLRTYAWQGGAGTWSDGKLVTRIGRNSDSVLAVRTIAHNLHLCFHALHYCCTCKLLLVCISDGFRINACM